MAKGLAGIALIVWLCLATVVAQVDPEFDLKVNRTWVNEFGRATTLVTLRNNTTRTFDIVSVKCTFLLNDEPVFIGEASSHHLRPGESDSVEVRGERNVKFDGARCRVADTLP